MHRRPPAVVSSPLAFPVPLSRKRSSLLSNASAPHTPTGGNSPLPLFFSNTNRNSTDSWNSSNYDGADDLEWEWKPEQIRLLSRTLDALPAHLLTPFNGPVPPSNLLDKIAKGVSQAKGPLDWPHSLRVTRAKIVELARIRAKETIDGDTSDTIAEESSGSDIPLQQTTNTGPKRPLYRQSSMDFMQTPKIDIKDNSNIRRLSHRLQRTERMLSSPSYHPYAQSSRSSSPAFGSPTRGTPSLNPSTPSSTTLNSSLSGPRPCHLRRSISSMSSASDQYVVSAVDPRVQRIKRADTFGGSNTFPRSLKRAPSFGSSRNSLESVAMSIDFSARDSDVTSDEEEKLRSRKAKKARTKATSPTPPTPLPLSSPLLSSPIKPVQRSKINVRTSPKTSRNAPSSKGSSRATPVKEVHRPRANVQRNPSIFGAELPNPQPNLEPPVSIRSVRSLRQKTPAATLTDSPTETNNPYTLTSIPTLNSPKLQSAKTLRRTKGPTIAARRAPARKISFGSIVPTSPEASASASDAGAGLGLGSAFQLH